MASSVDSTFDRGPDPGQGELARVDLEKTVIRQGELLDVSNISSHGKSGSHPNLQRSTDFLIGQYLDHFLIESLVGTGGMGAVFRGRDIRLDREVAIKVVPVAGRGAEAMKRFRIEAQSAAKLDHPNIARVYYVGETDEWSYIVFEFVEGINLRELVLEQGLLSIDDAVGLTRQVAEALQHAGERKVVHRDIKPSNILVTPSGQAKIVDMGLARTTELDKSTNDLTASGVTLGTFDYISPEQAHDPRSADVRSDIYSLGCTLYFLLTGRPPFPDGTALQKLLMHGTKMPEDPRFVRNDISDSMIAILRKMMAKKPADRYQTPADLIHDLRTVAELEGLVWTKSTDNTSYIPPNAERTWIESLLPLVISFLAIVIVTVWLHSNSYLSATFQIPRPSESATSEGEVQDGNLAQADANNNSSPEAEGDTHVSIRQNELKSNDPSAVRDTVIVDSSYAISDREKNLDGSIVRSLEQALELATAQPGIQRIILRSPSVTLSWANRKTSWLFRSGLTVQADPEVRCRLVVEGGDSSSDSTGSSVYLESASGPLTLQNVDLEWRTPFLGKRRGLFGVRAEGSLQLKNCTITIQHELTSSSNAYESSNALAGTAMPACIVLDVMPSEVLGEANANTLSRTMARVSAQDVSVRGQCDFLRMLSPIRTEVLVENSWFAIAGSMLDMGGSRSQSRTGVPLRIDMKNVTSYSLRPWMRVHMTTASPYPIAMVRTAKNCIFSGCKTLIDWNAMECEDWRLMEQSRQAQDVSKWIDLRGADNVYDSNSLTDYLQIRMMGNQTEIVALSVDAPIVREERGTETIASWRRRPVLEASRMHTVRVDALQYMATEAFYPGYQKPE